jgi:RNA polymerase sigma-70 factor, ECF subfamily
MSEALPEPETPELPTLSSTFLGNVQRKDPASWSRLVMTFAPLVYRWCRRAGIRESDTPDVVQDVFATVARGIEGFERQQANGSFRAWLATITRSRVRDFLRKNARHQLPVGGTEALERLQGVPDELDSTICYEGIESPLAQRTMELVKAEFEEVTWQAFWLTTIDGLSAAITAERLNLSLASVYQARTRVLRKLRQRISELPM